MLRANIDNIVVTGEQLVLLRLQIAILVEIILKTIVWLDIVIQRVAVIELPVLAEGKTIEITSQEQTAHVGVSQEHDTEEVVDLTLQQVSHLPNINDRRDIMHQLTIGITSSIRGNAVTTDFFLSKHLHRTTLVRISIL